MRQIGRRKNIQSLIGFELFVKTACLSLGFPVVRLMTELCMKASGYSYITKENLFSFVVSPLTLICIGAVLVVCAVFVMFEMNAVSIAVWKKYKKSEVTVTELFFGGIRRTGVLLRKKSSGVLLAVLTLLFAGIVNLPILLFFFFGIRQTESIAMIAMQPVWLLALAVLAVLLWWGAFLGCTVVLMAEIETGDIRTLMKNGWKGVKVCYGKILKRLFWRSLFLFLLEGLFYFIGLAVFVTVLVAVAPAELSGVLLLRLFTRYHLILCVLFASVNAVIQEYFCGSLYLEYRKKEEAVAEVMMQQPKRITDEKRRKGTAGLVTAGVVVFCMTAVEVLTFFRSGNLFLAEALDTLCVTAHRGASGDAPENTLAAVALAVESGADYVEIDVRQTADGVPVLLHDEALFRTTRVYNDIGNVTYREVANYDAGSSFSVAYAGEGIPALSQVLEQYGGKIGFNIELKVLRSRELTNRVVELIEEYHLEDSCVITSASYEQLEWVKEKNPAIKTGQILSFVYGAFYESTAADFFSIRSDFVTESLVEKIHFVGKELHVWTVNKESELRRMKTMGVDNIITDKPAYAREVLFESELTETLEGWLALLLSKK